MSDEIVKKYENDVFANDYGDMQDVSWVNEPVAEDVKVPDYLMEKTPEQASAMLDIPKQAYAGYLDAIAATADLIAEPLVGALGKPFKGESITRETGIVPKGEPAQTTAGAITKPLAQAAVGIGIASSAAAVSGIAKTVEGSAFLTKAAPWIKGFTGDLLAFDEHTKNLTDTLNDEGMQDNTLVKAASYFLKHEDGDGAIEARLKTAAEGALIGGAADALVKGLKYVKNTQVLKDSINTVKKSATEAVKIAKTPRATKISPETIPERVGNEPTTMAVMEENAKNYIKSNFGDKIGDVPVDKVVEDARKAGQDILPQVNALALKEADSFNKLGATANDAIKVFKATGDQTVLDSTLNAFTETYALRNKSMNAIEPLAQAMAFRSKTDAIVELNKIKNAIDSGDVSTKRKLVDIIATATNPDQANNLANGLAKSKGKLTYDAAIYLWQNSLLSSAKTFVSDTVATALWQCYNAAEIIPAAAVGAFRKGVLGKMGISTAKDAASLDDAYEMFKVYGATLKGGMSALSQDIQRAAKKESSLGNVFETTATHVENTALKFGDRFGKDVDVDFLTPTSWGISPDSNFFKTLNHLNKYMPTSLMAKKDDYIAGVRYMAENAKRASRIAKSEGLTGAEYDARVNSLKSNLEKTSGYKTQDEFMDWVNKEQAIPKEDAALVWGASKQSFRDTQIATFRDELGETASSIQKVINTMPAGKIIVPFFKTPVKLVWDRFFMERSLGAIPALAMQNSTIGRMFRAGGAERDTAIGQLALSSSLHIMGWEAFTSGHAMGTMPTDKKERDLLLAAGVRENSIKVGNEWIDISRYSPIADMVLYPANIGAIYQRHEDSLGHKEDQSAYDLMLLSMSGLANTMINKTWTENILNFVDIWNSESPERMKTYLNNLAASTVPALVSDVANILAPQEHQQQALGLWESLQKRAGLKTRDALDVFGEPARKEDLWLGFLPAKNITESDDSVVQEMIRVGAYVSKPDYTLDGIRLTDEERYRLTQIMGELNVKGSIANIIDSPVYKNLSDAEKTGIKGAQSLTKSGIIKMVYDKNKEMAKMRLLNENQDLKNRIERYKTNISTLSAQKPATKTLFPKIETP